jgi:cellulose biosynthesis protein BcsQ
MKMFKLKKNIKTEIIKKQIITFWSPFSQGATTCSYLFAKKTAELYPNIKVALLEFDMLHPSFKSFINEEQNKGFKVLMHPNKSNRPSFKDITDAAINVDSIDVFTNYFSHIDLSNLNINQLEKYLYMFRSFYDVVIIDTNRNFDNKLTDIALNVSDKILVPISASLNDINLLNEYLEIFEEFEPWSINKMKCIINKYKDFEPTSIEIESCMKLEIINYIKLSKNILSDKNVIKSMEKMVVKEVMD